jgi:nucleotide-binding universal stress UspA family protein
MSFERILVAIDDGEPAECAADVANRLAAQLGATLAFVHVLPRTVIAPNELGFVDAETVAQVQHRAHDLLRLARQRAEDTASDLILREGLPAQEIAAAAREWNADLIVIGNHSRPLVKRLLLSNTTKGVLHQAPCPVLVVSQPIRSASGEKAVATTATAPR